MSENDVQNPEVKEEELKTTLDSEPEVENAEATESVEPEVVEEQQPEVEVLTAAQDQAIKALEEQISKLKDDNLRLQAEIQNTRRRSEQEIDKARKYAVDRFVRDLLPALDPMEKALQFADRENEATKSLVQGLDATFDLLQKALKNNGVEVVNPEGEAFDPNFHQAVQAFENPNVPANQVMAVMQKGYVLNGRVVRPAMVIVSKGAPAESTISENV